MILLAAGVAPSCGDSGVRHRESVSPAAPSKGDARHAEVPAKLAATRCQQAHNCPPVERSKLAEDTSANCRTLRTYDRIELPPRPTANSSMECHVTRTLENRCQLACTLNTSGWSEERHWERAQAIVGEFRDQYGPEDYETRRRRTSSADEFVWRWEGPQQNLQVISAWRDDRSTSSTIPNLVTIVYEVL